MMEAEEGVKDHISARRGASVTGHPLAQTANASELPVEEQAAGIEAQDEDARTCDESKGFDVTVTEEEGQEQAEMYD